MQVQVNTNKLVAKSRDYINENEYNIHEVNFDFAEEFTIDLVKVALFTRGNKTYKMIIANNKCNIPTEILQEKGTFILGVYAYEESNGELLLRYSPSPIQLFVSSGSYIEDAENSEPITPSELEQYQQALQDGLSEVSGTIESMTDLIDEVQTKLDNGEFDGADGQDGEDGFSPILEETQTSTGYDISITDKNGTRTISLTNGQDGNANPQIFYWDGATNSTGLNFWNEVYQAQKEKPCIVIHTKVLKGNYVTFSWKYNNNMPTTSFETIEPNVYSRVVSSVNQSSGFDSLSVYWFSLYFTITNDVVTKINTNSSTSKVDFLSTTRDYNQLYTPLYNGSPVTKKYVDDSISNAITNAIGGSY